MAKKKKSLKRTQKNSRFPIVGVGASAGGLEAIIGLLSPMPVDIGMAFVLVQHLDPNHPSMAVEIISRSTKLVIEEARDGTIVKPNQVYIIPPNHNMEIHKGVLNLSKRSEGPVQNKSINIFLKSLAQSEKGRTIGIILSGTGSDGSAGLRAIKAEGGITYAQQPESAKYQDMPKNAIAAGAVDFVLPPIEIARALVRRKTHPNQPEQQPEQQPEHLLPSDPLHTIYAVLRKHTKIDFTDYKQTTLNRRIQRRMSVNRSKNLQDYAKYLENYKEEVTELYNDILINVTDFFRDPESFIALKENIFPALLQSKPAGETIRVWVPGCSTGEEVYSIAISLIEFLGDLEKQNPIQIFATDISEPVIQKGRVGQYPESISQNVSKERLDRFFDRLEDGYRINKSVRDQCLFSKHDVTSDPPFARLDLISCRNVLIYFGSVLQKQVIPTFHYALNPRGYLWLGKAENPGEFSKLFTLVEKSHKVYSKVNVATPMAFHALIKRVRGLKGVTKEPPTLARIQSDFQKDADRITLSIFAPPSVIINADLEILQFRGRTAPFLEPATGQPSLNLLKMARPELLASIRATINAVKKENTAVVEQGVHFEAEGQQIGVDIEILPTNPLAEPQDRTFLVLFKETSTSKKVRSVQQVKAKKTQAKNTQKSTPDAKHIKMVKLENELSEIKAYQQALIEQYEANQEELTSANEELQSTNEEFMSANEEIETSKEELQSTNEELVTVNDELQIRNADLSALSSDLNNLLASVENPVLIVGGDLSIRRFSPKAKSAFNLITTDIGRPINDIKSNFDINLEVMVTEVVETLSPKKIEVQDVESRWWQVEVRPFRRVDNKIDGAVITVLDIDALKKNEIRAKETHDYITSVAESVPLPLAVVNDEFQFQSANQSFYKYFQLFKQTVGQDIFAALNISGDNLQGMRLLFSQAVEENKSFADIEVDCELPISGLRKILLSGGKIHWTGSERAAVLVSFLDVTEQRHYEKEMKEILSREKTAREDAEKANRAKDVFLATVSHELRTPLSPILTWAQLISQGKVDFEKAKQGALVIEQSAKTQNQLIDDLLDVSRIILGKLALEIKEVDLNSVIRAALDSVRALAEKKSIQIETLLSSESAVVYADPIRIQQIIWNLLTNAIKFSPQSGIIQVRLEFVGDQTKRLAQIIVADQGKGIPEKSIPHIFNRFSQVDSESTRVHGGLGLGLSIVHSLVELHNGTIKVENASVGEGAIFTVVFPLIVSDKSAIVRTQALNGSVKRPEVRQLVSNDIKGQPKLDKMRILFVDDDQSTREAISIYLKSFGADVMTVESAGDALAKLPDFKPDILISDIAMPGEDGYALIGKIRSLNDKPWCNIPALALSAYATAEDSKKALLAGFQAHVAKPVEANELGIAILKVTEGKTNLWKKQKT